jgi:nucleoid DNA-binding protein
MKDDRRERSMLEETTMSFVIGEVAAELDWPKGDVKDCLETFFQIVGDELAEGNVVVTSHLRFYLGTVAAVKKGTPVRNPFTGETKPSPGKPAALTIKVKPRPKLKEALPDPASKEGKAIVTALQNRKVKAA